MDSIHIDFDFNKNPLVGFDEMKRDKWVRKEKSVDDLYVRLALIIDVVIWNFILVNGHQTHPYSAKISALTFLNSGKLKDDDQILITFDEENFRRAYQHEIESSDANRYIPTETLIDFSKKLLDAFTKIFPERWKEIQREHDEEIAHPISLRNIETGEICSNEYPSSNDGFHKLAEELKQKFFDSNALYQNEKESLFSNFCIYKYLHGGDRDSIAKKLKTLGLELVYQSPN